MHTAELILRAYRSERIQSKLSKGKCGAKSSGRQGKTGSCQGQGVIRAPAISKDCREKLEFRAATFPEKSELQRGDLSMQQCSQTHLKNC